MNVHSGSPSVTVGEIVAAAFDHAQSLTTDQDEAADLAGRLVARWLSRAGREDLASQLQFCGRQLEGGSRFRGRAVAARAA